MISPRQSFDLVRYAVHLQRSAKCLDFHIEPKTATVHTTTPLGARLGYHEGQVRTEEGRWHTPLRSGERAVFRFPSIAHEQKQLFHEIKGYGLNGKHLYPFHHCEDDLNFGMYPVHAKREFDIMRALEESGRTSSMAIAYLEFSMEEFYRCVCNTLAALIMLERRSSRNRLSAEAKEQTQELADQFHKLLREDGIPAVVAEVRKEELLSPALEKSCEEWHTITTPPAYIARGLRNPFRLAGIDPKYSCPRFLAVDDLEEAAFEAGKTYDHLLNLGYVHHVPSAGNITLCGELMDFEDASSVDDHELITDSWKFMAKQFSMLEKRPVATTFPEYIALTLGPHFIDRYVPAFLRGTGRGATPEQVADTIIEQHRDAFGELVALQLNLSDK